MTPGEPTREFYREQGRKQEQERIIKLLETTANDSEHTQHYAEECWCSGWLSVIGLIKGEK